MWIEIDQFLDFFSQLIRHATYVACGLKFFQFDFQSTDGMSCHVCGMWIEISITVYTVQALPDVMPRMWHVD